MPKTLSVPSLLVTHRSGSDYSVWISLPGHDPVLDPYGFIVGCGDTRDEAMSDAVDCLEAAIEQMQAPIGVIAERDEDAEA